MKNRIFLALSAAAFASSAQAALIADWRLNEASGSIVDSTGNHVAGTATGTATYSQSGVPNGTYDLPVGGASITVAGATGTSIEFGPRTTDELFTVGTTNDTAVQNIDSTGSFTAMAWINPTTLETNTTHRIISTGGTSLSPGTGGWGFGLQSGGTATTGSIRLTTFFVADNDSATFPIATGTWYHLAVTYNNGVINYFLDGELLGGGDTSLFNNEAATGRLTIGSRLGGTDLDQVVGRLDGIHVYDTVLTGAEIQAAAVASVIPEPSTALLGGLGILALLRRRRN